MSYTKVYFTKSCAVCNVDFIGSDKRKRYCSLKCKNTHNSKQFSNRHKNTRYFHFHKLLIGRPELSQEILEEIFQNQFGLCALSQEPMTWFSGRGKTRTNISIDRIAPGGSYTKDNVRLVCTIVNSMRNNMSDEELIWWCSRIYHK